MSVRMHSLGFIPMFLTGIYCCPLLVVKHWYEPPVGNRICPAASTFGNYFSKSFWLSSIPGGGESLISLSRLALDIEKRIFATQTKKVATEKLEIQEEFDTHQWSYSGSPC